MKSIFFVTSLLLSSIAFSQATPVESPWKNESELGIVSVSGNTKSESYTAKQTTSYAWDKNLLNISGRYLETKSGSLITGKSWSAGTRYERTLSDMWSLFAGHKADADRFAGFIQRDTSDLGAKYFIKKTEDLNWIAELGYSYIKTYSTNRKNTYDPSARIYTEATKSLEKNLSLKYWIEYVQSFRESDVYFINTELSLNVMLNQVLSLKTGYLLKYQNTLVPPINEYADKTFTTALVAKF